MTPNGPCGSMRLGDHRGIVKIEKCGFEVKLDMTDLVCTRGRRFPLARLANRLRCPNCGDLNVKILFDVPGPADPGPRRNLACYRMALPPLKGLHDA
jgi:hypothetical protein